ncbi:aminopeptidase P N-terminal domain-containing protein, partial [Erwinia amylovora]|uniref:aminopeptidase P N-terminal domain-containing protein n=1 Tax=Erwinia amylovora TaxID=552 RepID=UPI00200B1C37
FNEPEALLLLIKIADNHHHSVLFNLQRDLTAEIWFGRRLGQEAAPARLAVDRALPWDDMANQSHLLLNGLDIIYHALGQFAFADSIVFSALEKLRAGARQN